MRIFFSVSYTGQHYVTFTFFRLQTAFTVEELPDSQVKISGELPYAELQSERTAVVAPKQNVTLDGFQKVHPYSCVRNRTYQKWLSWPNGWTSIAHAYPHIIEEHKIEAIGQPQIEVTKLLPKRKSLGLPRPCYHSKFALPDYEAIAKEVKSVQVMK